MSEPQTNGRYLRHSPIKGENDDAGKLTEFNLNTNAAHWCSGALLSLPPPRVKGFQ